mmetsp:Transcript_44520/g.123248  ORF Transcript_44520/g.123248 Transcript_44520/m.123248 type:complete len:1252 (-) Transcript_44520:30-3785(-)
MLDTGTLTPVTHICVSVRCRPMSGKELVDGSTSAVDFEGPSELIVKGLGEQHRYAFDHVFAPAHSQGDIFNVLGVALLDSAFDGYNSTIFAYGQTGSGKTHTMMNHRADTAERGLIPRIADGLFQRIAALTQEHASRSYLVCCSFLEMYNEIIFDLMLPKAKQNKSGLEIKEHRGVGVFVKDLKEMVVQSADELNRVIETGFGHRATAATKMNETSSRSHCVCTIQLHQKDTEDESKNTFSKVNLVDLAGSERAKSTEASGDRLKEGANINKSLSALGNVINALSSIACGNRKVFVPYRNSKLTRVLQESLGGNCLCTMVAAISPSSANLEETLSTLNYAKRAKTIKVSATRNEEASYIKKLEAEVEALQRKLEEHAMSGERAAPISAMERQEIEAKYEAQIQDVQALMATSWEEKRRLSDRHAEDQAKFKVEARRAAELVRIEQQRRLQLLEQRHDIKLTMQAFTALDGGTGKMLQEKINGLLRVEKQLRSQMGTVKAFRESAKADFKVCTGCQVGAAGAMLTLLSQVSTKLGSMRPELDTLAQLEAQMEEHLGQISPELASAVLEAQVGNGSPRPADGGDAEARRREETLQLLMLAQRQLALQVREARVFIKRERRQMGFMAEMSWLRQCLEEGDVGHSELLEAICSELASSAPQAPPQDDAEDDEATEAPPRPLGLSTLEHPDERLSSSSNTSFARCARLMQVLGIGGWCPGTDSPGEFLEVDLGAKRLVTGLGVQGRMPCTGDCGQTRDLLLLAFEGTECKPPTSDSAFKRPPVRLVYDVGAALCSERGAVDDGMAALPAPSELLPYSDVSRDQKIDFFEKLIAASKEASPGMEENEMGALTLTPQDILSGKNSVEVNRLLQLLAYMCLASSSSSPTGGVVDPAPQWVTRWKLAYFSKDIGWAWYGAPGGVNEEEAQVFDGSTDASTVTSVMFPETFGASKLRVHPVEWHRHAGLRCEVYVSPGGTASEMCSPTMGRTVGTTVLLTQNDNLDGCLDLVRRGVEEVAKRIEERQRERQCEEASRAEALDASKFKAEHERDALEQQLKEALATVAELEKKRLADETRVASAETALLQARVDCDRLGSEAEQLSSDLASKSQAAAAEVARSTELQEKGAGLRTSLEELTENLQVMAEERDLARAKEEELFDDVKMKDEDLLETNQGYVDLTLRLQEQEEELFKLGDRVMEGQSANETLAELCKQLQDDSLRALAESKRLKIRLRDEENITQTVLARLERLKIDFSLPSDA